MALALVWACQSTPLVESPGGFRHSTRGWSLAAPPAATWRPVSVDQSLLAYRRRGAGAPTWMTLSSRCRVALAEPRMLARHLRIGIPEHTVRGASAVPVGGLDGWQQVFDAREARARVRVKTVTAVVDGCALDWVLSVGGGRGFEAAERDFDAWWQSFRPGSSAEEEVP